MPLVFLLVAGVVGWLAMSQSKRVLGFLKGAPFFLEVVPVGNGASLEVGAAHALERMRTAAKGEGVELPLSGEVSGFRTSAQQLALQKAKGKFGVDGGLAADAGMSPHQTGRAADFEGINPAASNFNKARHAWMHRHGPSFGWFPVGDSYRTTKEPWHWEFTPVG